MCSLDARSKIVKSLIAGDVDGALRDTAATFPTVLEREQGLMLFKLRCRKFVELILDTADALKRTQGECADGLSNRATSTALAEAAQISLTNALAYGQQLEFDYKDDTRPEISTYLKRTFSVVAYEDPLNAAGEVGRTAGQESRNTLAVEMNEAILGTSGEAPTVTSVDNWGHCRGLGETNSTHPRIHLPPDGCLSGTAGHDGRWECCVC